MAAMMRSFAREMNGGAGGWVGRALYIARGFFLSESLVSGVCGLASVLASVPASLLSAPAADTGMGRKCRMRRFLARQRRSSRFQVQGSARQ